MNKSPIYRYNAKPRFSANQFTDYMATVNASQRDKLIQKAKFPASKPVTSYQFAKREIQDFFLSGKGDFSFFDHDIANLEHKITYDEEKRDDARRDLRCIKSFLDLMKGKKFSKYDIQQNKADVPIKTKQGVTINVRLDASLTETSKEGVTNSGGIVLFTAATKESRKNIEVRLRRVSQLIIWSLESKGNIAPLPRLCMSIDVFGNQIVKASVVSDRFRRYAQDACKEIALKWDSVQPPSDYDGPAWQ